MGTLILAPGAIIEMTEIAPFDTVRITTKSVMVRFGPQNLWLLSFSNGRKMEESGNVSILCAGYTLFVHMIRGRSANFWNNVSLHFDLEAGHW